MNKEEDEEVDSVYKNKFYIFQIETNNNGSLLNPSYTANNNSVSYDNKSSLSSSESENGDEDNNKQCIYSCLLN